MPEPYRVEEDSVEVKVRWCGRICNPPLRCGGSIDNAGQFAAAATFHGRSKAPLGRGKNKAAQCCPYNGNPPIHSVYWVCERPILKGLGVFL